MGADGIREFIKWFYPQIRKEGLVVDVRANGGGNVSQMILRAPEQRAAGPRFRHLLGPAGTTPGSSFTATWSCLIRENSASDGDIFPAYVPRGGLGPLIGKRTWGGVVGITNRGRCSTAAVFVPEFGTNSAHGEWIIEGEGVEPPTSRSRTTRRSLIEGRDPQLERVFATSMPFSRQVRRRTPAIAFPFLGFSLVLHMAQFGLLAFSPHPARLIRICTRSSSSGSSGSSSPRLILTPTNRPLTPCSDVRALTEYAPS
jgi:tricorn protease